MFSLMFWSNVYQNIKVFKSVSIRKLKLNWYLKVYKINLFTITYQHKKKNNIQNIYSVISDTLYHLQNYLKNY